MVRLSVMLLLCVVSSVANADFFVQIKDATPSSYQPGNSGVLEVWGRHNEGVNITLNSFTLSFDLATNGLFSAVSGANSITGAAVVSAPTAPFSPQNYDFGFRVPAQNAQVMVPNNSYKLFDINFTISNSAAPGSYNLSFIANALNLVSGGPGTANANIVTYNGGSSYVNPTTAGRRLFADPVAGFQGAFTIVAIPEPSSLALVGLVGCGLGFFRRRKVN